MRQCNLSVLSATFAGCAYTFENSAFPVVLTLFVKDGLIESDRALVLASAFNALLVIGLLTGISLNRRFVLHYSYMLGLGLFLVGGLLFCFAMSPTGMLAGRLLQGAGAGLFSPLIPVLLYSSSHKRRNSRLSIWAASTGIVGFTAPFFASIVGVSYSWRIVWMTLCVLTLISLSIGLRGGTRFSFPKVEAKHSVEMKQLWSIPVLSILAYIFVMYGLISSMLYSLPDKTALSGSDPLRIGMVSAAPWIFFSISCYVIGKVEKISLNAILIVGAVILASSLALSSSGVGSQPIWLLACAASIGVSMAFANVPTTMIAFSLVKENLRGVVSSLDILAARSGAVFFLTFHSQSAPNAALLAAAVLTAFACVAFLPKRYPTGR